MLHVTCMQTNTHVQYVHKHLANNFTKLNDDIPQPLQKTYSTIPIPEHSVALHIL